MAAAIKLHHCHGMHVVPSTGRKGKKWRVDEENWNETEKQARLVVSR
jgi:hypothetical protein